MIVGPTTSQPILEVHRIWHFNPLGHFTERCQERPSRLIYVNDCHTLRQIINNPTKPKETNQKLKDNKSDKNGEGKAGEGIKTQRKLHRNAALGFCLLTDWLTDGQALRIFCMPLKPSLSVEQSERDSLCRCDRDGYSGAPADTMIYCWFACRSQASFPLHFAKGNSICIHQVQRHKTTSSWVQIPRPRPTTPSPPGQDPHFAVVTWQIVRIGFDKWSGLGTY